MLLKLMEYDFGYMFSKPVDCDAVPGYKDLVKHPMDLGTICEKLINGGYCKFLEERNSFDDVITAVLKAIELVWHNCYTFNFDGSAIYRMADVQRRRARAMQDRSFGKLLTLRELWKLPSTFGKSPRGFPPFHCPRVSFVDKTSTHTPPSPYSTAPTNAQRRSTALPAGNMATGPATITFTFQ